MKAWTNSRPTVGSSRLRHNMCSSDLEHFAEFSEDALSQFDFPAGEQLSELQGCGLDMSPPNPQSPIFRSMSRSSFGSSSYTESSPVDHPTPASDSSVTTPALSEAAFGWLPEFPHSLFGQQAPAFAPEAKTKGELECSYVHAFPGSAPLSPNAFLTYSFDVCQQPEPVALPSNEGSGLTGARRHSEPASLAALQFPRFFQEPLAQIASSAPDAPATRPITDNLACPPSTAGPSSIAPHQTQLPPRLEIAHPRPVRAFKPPILRGDCSHYDPKDFVRRHSEPVLPLRELDVFSHVPEDVPEESSDEDEGMVVTGDEDEVYDTDYSSDGMDDENLMEEFVFEGMDGQNLPVDTQQPFLFEPEWSWPQPASDPATSTEAASHPTWPGADMFGGNIDWATAFIAPPTSDTQVDGFQHL